MDRQDRLGISDYFHVTAELLERGHVELVFEGLDTYANVFLNDEPLISTDNMFASGG